MAASLSTSTAGPPLSSRTMASRFDIGRPVSCLAIADMPTGGRCGDNGVIFAVGGRSTLKVLRVGRDGIIEVCAQLNPNAQTMKKRTGAPQNATFDICDLAWSGVTTLAAATKNGVISVWDVDGSDTCTLQRRIEAHKRTINKIKWHPSDPQLLASASHDGTVKFWNRRTRMNRESAGTEGATATIQPNAGAVRDIAFCPKDFRVALACESGVIAIYDRRRVNVPLMRWVGHGADVQCIEWHPESQHLIATTAAAPDATCKVWDVSGGGMNERADPIHSIYPAGAVNRLRWRPTSSHHPSSSSNLNKDPHIKSMTASQSGLLEEPPSHQWQLAMECRHSVIQVWDVREGYLPVAVLHPPAASVFSESTHEKTAESKKLESVEFGAFEWLDTPVPTPDKLVGSSSWASFRGNESAVSHQFSGLWQHLITTVKVGNGGSVLVLSCAAATQPPIEVAPVAFSMSPMGDLAAVHQPQPMLHHCIPPFHLHSTCLLNNPNYNNHLGIFHVEPSAVQCEYDQENEADDSASITSPIPESTSSSYRSSPPPAPAPRTLSYIRSTSSSNSVSLEESESGTESSTSSSLLLLEPLGLSLGSLKLTHRTNQYEELMRSTVNQPQLFEDDKPHRNIEITNTFDNSFSEWTDRDEQDWKKSKQYDRMKAQIAKSERCLNAVELAARALGHGTADAMRRHLQHTSITSENLETLGRVFIGRRVLYAHRSGGGYIGGIDPRPGAAITFVQINSRKKRGTTVAVRVCITDYLRQHQRYSEYFKKHPIVFASSLPCFHVANKDGRLDSFPMETCFVVLTKHPDRVNPLSKPMATSPQFPFQTALQPPSLVPPSFPLQAPFGGHFAQMSQHMPSPLAFPGQGYGPPPLPLGEGSASLSITTPAVMKGHVECTEAVLAKKYRLMTSTPECPHECESAADLCAYNAQVAITAGAKHLSIIWGILGNMLTEGGEDSEEDEDDEEEEDASDDSNHDDDDDSVSTAGSESDVSSEGDDMQSQDSSIERGGRGGRNRNSIKPLVSTAAALALLSPEKKKKEDRLIREALKHRLSKSSELEEVKERNGSVHCLSSISWLLEKSVRPLLDERCCAGDVQTCVAVCCVLRCANPTGMKFSSHSSLLDAVSTAQQRKEWTWCYIEYLRMLNLPIQANELIKACDEESINQLNTNSTSVYAACASCKKPIASSSTRFLCSKCKAVTSMCVLCREPVRGLFAVCPGCGHGGHLPHLKTWFRDQDTCPSGCGHVCDFNTYGIH